MTSESR